MPSNSDFAIGDIRDPEIVARIQKILDEENKSSNNEEILGGRTFMGYVEVYENIIKSCSDTDKMNNEMDLFDTKNIEHEAKLSSRKINLEVTDIPIDSTPTLELTQKRLLARLYALIAFYKEQTGYSVDFKGFQMSTEKMPQGEDIGGITINKELISDLNQFILKTYEDIKDVEVSTLQNNSNAASKRIEANN